MDKKFFKINLIFKDFHLSNIESAAFNATLLGYNILNTEYEEKNLKAISKGIKNANKKLKELQIDIKKTLISIDFKFNYDNLDQLLSRITKLYSKKKDFDILNISFINQNYFFIDNFINQLSKIDNPLIYVINLNRNKLSNSSINIIIKNFYEKVSKNLIIEIDYLSYNEKGNNLNSDLQILSTADIIYKNLNKKNTTFRNAKIIIPIRKNSNIIKLAKKCSVKFDGINFKEKFDYLFDKKLINFQNISSKEIKQYLLKEKDNLNRIIKQ